MTASEPVEAEVEDENAVAPQATHLASTQTGTHEYLTQSGKVMRETVKTDGTVTSVLDFIYDESGKPFALNYSTNGGSGFTTYCYVLNLQGDVVKLVTESGAVAASTGGKVMPYAFAAVAWVRTTVSAFSKDPVERAKSRGYHLK